MKKKLFLFLVIVCALICALAISVSARHEYTELDDNALTNLDVKITLTDGTSEFDTTVKFKSLFNYSLTPKTETTAYSLSLSGIKATTVTVDGTDYTLKTSMTAIYFPDGVTHLNKSFMNQYSTVFSKAHLPDSIEFIGDKVFYKIGTFSLVDKNGNPTIYLPENLTAIANANGQGESHFLSGCILQGDTLVFPEGFTNFGCDYPLNDGFGTASGTLKLVFLGRMTNVDLAGSSFTNVKISMHFANNTADDAYLTYSDSTVCRRVEARLIDGAWYYAYTNALDDSDLSYQIDTTGKTLAINYKNNDPNSTATKKTIDNKNWYSLDTNIPIAYFCSGEVMFGARNGAFGWMVYSSEPVKYDDVHPFDDGGKLVDATCTMGAGIKYSCGACGAFLRLEEQTSDPLGHEYTEDDLISSTKLSCIQDEANIYHCSRCEEDFAVVINNATGHNMSVVTYPVEATTTSYGTRRTSCANCDYFEDVIYGLNPGDTLMTVILDNGDIHQIKASLVFVYTYDESTLVAKITGLNGSFYVNDVNISTSSINKIIVPFGFTIVGYNFAGRYDVEIFDFSLTKNMSLANGAFRDNGYIEQVILGDGATVNSQAFRGISKFNSLVICDGATVVFSAGIEIFTNDTTGLKEIIIGKNANVTIARSGFATTGVRASLERIIVGDGATVTFGASSFGALTSINEFTFGKDCVVDFGASSFAGTQISSLSFPDSATIKFTGNGAFSGCTALKTVYLPASVTSIPKETFTNCTALETVVLMGATSIGENAFNATTDKTLTIFSHANGDLSINSSAFANRASVVLYTMSTNVTSLSTTSYTIYSGIPHSQYEAKLDPTCTEDGYDGYATICPCGAIASEVTYTIYATDAEPTSGSYGIHTVIPNLGGHTDKIVILYANGFDKEGAKTVNCAVCDIVLSESTPVKAIFVHEGYSYKLNGTITGIQSAFKVNKEELEAYEAASEKKLTFGMIIANPTYLGDTFFTNGKVNADKGAIQVQVDIGDYSVFSCYISGFQKIDPQVNLELVIAGYVYEGDDTSSLKLMQKTYEVGEESPIVSKVTKGTDVLHTVNIANVKAPVALPSDIKEFGSQEQE